MPSSRFGGGGATCDIADTPTAVPDYFPENLGRSASSLEFVLSDHCHTLTSQSSELDRASSLIAKSSILLLGDKEPSGMEQQVFEGDYCTGWEPSRRISDDVARSGAAVTGHHDAVATCDGQVFDDPFAAHCLSLEHLGGVIPMKGKEALGPVEGSVVHSEVGVWKSLAAGK